LLSKNSAGLERTGSNLEINIFLYLEKKGVGNCTIREDLRLGGQSESGENMISYEAPVEDASWNAME
jgi:hypothetical protein